MTVARTAFEKLRAHHESVPSLSDVIERYAERAFLDIELKVAGAEDELLEALRRWRPQRGYFVSSFQPEILRDLRARDKRLPLGLIADKVKQLKLWRELDVEYVVPHKRLISAELVHELKQAGKQIFVWTVNDARAMKRLATLGVDGLVSDDTELLGHTLG